MNLKNRKCLIRIFTFSIAINLIFSQQLIAQISVSADSSVIGKYDVFELNINHLRNYSNNWEDVNVQATFKGPQTITVSGFFYEQNLWKVRFAPPSAGQWSYTVTFTTPENVYTAEGTFVCIDSKTKGFLTRHPHNPYRLVFPDGSLFNGLGFEDCALDFNANGNPLDDWGFDGKDYPIGALGDRIKLDDYMSAYGMQGAGFNLFRWTTDNCTFKLYGTIAPEGNSYLLSEGRFGDTLVQSLRKNNIRIWLTFFGPPLFSDLKNTDRSKEAAIKRYIDYVIARYGAYTDIWELFNESSATAYYYDTISAYIRSIDPYHRLISVSDERPELASIDIISPHWYEKESELESDSRAYSKITSKKKYGKPIIFGEQGNSVQNWDVLSAERMRLRVWTSFFAEGILIFWNTGYAKNYMHPVAANIYLGPKERQYIKSLRDFSAVADTTAAPFQLNILNPNQVRGYALGMKDKRLGYFHHYQTHAIEVTTSIKIRLPRPGKIYWIDPQTNDIIDSSMVSFGTQVITSPAFKVDLAMRIDLTDSSYVYDEVQKLDLIVYPNPTSGRIFTSGNFSGTANFNLFRTDGSLVFSRNNIYNGQQINLDNIAIGVYIYRIVTGKRMATGKLIINK